MKGRKQMNVIRHSPDRNEDAVLTSHDSANVLVQARLDLMCDVRHTALRTKDNVIV